MSMIATSWALKKAGGISSAVRRPPCRLFAMWGWLQAKRPDPTRPRVSISSPSHH